MSYLILRALVLFLTINAGRLTRRLRKKPNILFIVLDDLGWTDISLNGAEYSTPTIDKILSDGLRFTNYYTHSSCTPTRASIMTGRYSWTTGLQEVVLAGTTKRIPSSFVKSVRTNIRFTNL